MMFRDKILFLAAVWIIVATALRAFADYLPGLSFAMPGSQCFNGLFFGGGALAFTMLAIALIAGFVFVLAMFGNWNAKFASISASLAAYSGVSGVGVLLTIFLVLVGTNRQPFCE